MGYEFPKVEPMPNVKSQDWNDWRWQVRNSLSSLEDYQKFFDLSESEVKAFSGEGVQFRVRTTPYYASLAKMGNQLGSGAEDPIRKILMPNPKELIEGYQQQKDPLGELKHNPAPRIIHRYTDRALFLVTDMCSVYCRYCTRKHFTGQDQVFIKEKEYQKALDYLRAHKEIKEVILSGGDPLTLSDDRIEKVLKDIREIKHIDIIRIGSRGAVVLPQRITENFVKMLRKYQPVFFMSHFSHPREITTCAAEALTRLVDNGIPVMNQFVLLNGINNDARIVKALSRRLLYLRVKPYYMFQCDPSEGTDHLRTSVENSMQIQKELWGHLSGLAMPQLSLDIPDGGGKVSLVPDFQTKQEGSVRHFKGWDGVMSLYISPPEEDMRTPTDAHLWQD